MKSRYIAMLALLSLTSCTSTIEGNRFPRSDMGLKAIAKRIVSKGDKVAAARDSLREHGFHVQDKNSQDFRQGILRWPYGENTFSGSRQEASSWPIRYWTIVIKHNGERVIDVESSYKTEYLIFDM